MHQNKEADELLNALLGKVTDGVITRGILGNLPPEHYRFPHEAFYFAYHKLSKKYPKTFNLYFTPLKSESLKNYCGEVEDIIFTLGASGVMSTATGRRYQYMDIDEEMVKCIKKSLLKELNKEQNQALELISKDFVKYIKEYSN